MAHRQLTQAEVAQLRSAPLPLSPAAEDALPARVWSNAACLVSGDPLPPVRMPCCLCLSPLCSYVTCCLVFCDDPRGLC